MSSERGLERTASVVRLWLALLPFTAHAEWVSAQSRAELLRERAEYVAWLTSSPTSPFAAVAHQVVGTGLRLGPASADIPLAGVVEHRITPQGGSLLLQAPEGSRPLPRGRPTRLGPFTLLPGGPAEKPTLTVFGKRSVRKRPSHYPYNPALVFTGRLAAPDRPEQSRLLAPDGTEVVATEAGSVLVPTKQGAVRLRVMRLPTGPEESELEIFFRDSTSGEGTYPAGRFVTLEPLGDGRVRLDFNRARNPFCAYNSVYPCPLPWRGNFIPQAIEAGERYAGGGLANPFSSPGLEDRWRSALDLAGGELRFELTIERSGGGLRGRLCNGAECQPFSQVRLVRDSLVLEMADYAATITAAIRADSLKGFYRNVGNRGPRTIPFRAARGSWPRTPAPRALLGRWDATYLQDWGTSPRVFEFRNGSAGLEGTIISNTGDYGHFWGTSQADSFAIGHFDGSFVYLLTGRLVGDTLRGVFHAGLRTQTRWVAVRSKGSGHLKAPTEVTEADTSDVFRFAFRDLEGRLVTNEDPRFKGKVMLVDVFGSWCPTCHDAAPTLTRLYRRYHARGLEIVGLAYEVTGDTAIDARQVRRYRDKFGIPYPLLLAGINDSEAAAATLPQLRGFTAFPTTLFLDRNGKVRRVHAGFYGPATGAQHQKLVREFEREVEGLLREKRKGK